jgi:hypothetical protein
MNIKECRLTGVSNVSQLKSDRVALFVSVGEYEGLGAVQTTQAS